MAQLVVAGCLELSELALCFASTNLVEAWLDTFVVLNRLVGATQYARLVSKLVWCFYVSLLCRLQTQVTRDGVDLIKVLPQQLRNVQAMAAAVRQRELVHLFPLLRLESDLQGLHLTGAAHVAQEMAMLMERYPGCVEYWDPMGQALLAKAARSDWPASLTTIVVGVLALTWYM